MERREDQRRKTERRSGLDRRKGPLRGPDRRRGDRRSGYDRRILDLQVESMSIPILRCTGRITIGSPARYFVETCKSLLENNLVIGLDLQKIMHIDSTGVGALLSVLTSTRRQNGDLILIAPSEKVEAVLRITSLRNLFRIFASVEEAGIAPAPPF